MRRLSFAVIGGGPAGFYLAKQLLGMKQAPKVDIYEKQLCPFGLLRYGVAPDHISIKKSQIVLSSFVSNPNFAFVGNSPISAVKLGDLSTQYSGVVYTIGAQADNTPPWCIPTVYQAREIVMWYNSHPSKQNYKMELSTKRTVLIVGNGNVGIDIARVLLRDRRTLRSTELSEEVCGQLESSGIRNIIMVGRRGVSHSAFSLKEVRELHTMKIQLYAYERVNCNRMQCLGSNIPLMQDHFSHIVRMNKRKIDFIKEHFNIVPQEQLEGIMKQQHPKVIFRYLLSPKEIKDSYCVMDRRQLKGEAFKQTSVQSGNTVEIAYDMMINSTGFRVEPFEGDEYNSLEKSILNSNGCVMKGDKVKIGKYAAGWCKTGAKGVLDETLLSCEETFNNIRMHCAHKLLLEKEIPAIDMRNKTDFQMYANLKDIELKRGNEKEFIKKKLKDKEIRQLFGIK